MHSGSCGGFSAHGVQRPATRRARSSTLRRGRGSRKKMHRGASATSHSALMNRIFPLRPAEVSSIFFCSTLSATFVFDISCSYFCTTANKRKTRKARTTRPRREASPAPVGCTVGFACCVQMPLISSSFCVRPPLRLRVQAGRVPTPTEQLSTARPRLHQREVPSNENYDLA